MTKGEFKLARKRAIAAMKAKHKRELAALEKQSAHEIEMVNELGGILDRNEAIQFLEISNPRFSVIRDRFREWTGFYSLADLKEYKRKRNPNGGRPRKTVTTAHCDR